MSKACSLVSSLSSASFGVVLPLDIFGRMRCQVESAEAKAECARFQLPLRNLI